MPVSKQENLARASRDCALYSFCCTKFGHGLIPIQNGWLLKNMCKQCLLPIVTFILLCPFVVAGQTEFTNVDQFLKSILSGEARLDSKAEGDLNGDGLVDWTGLIHRERAGAAPTYQLYVMLRVPQGGYRVAVESKQEEIAGMGCCWVEDLRIERSSIYIQSNAKTAATMEAATHQFKLYKGEWRLVGLNIYYIDHSSDVSTETDMNVLTGAIVEKRQKSDRKATVRRRSKRFGVYLLKDFDFLNTFGTE